MARWKARVEFLLSVIELLYLSLTVEALQAKMSQNSLPSGGTRSLGAKISGGRGRTPANILLPLESQVIALQLAAESLYIMKLCCRLFVLHCRSRPKYDTSMHFDPHFEEVRGGVQPWWMARWKARVEFLLSVIELLFLSVAVEAL